MPCLPLIPMVFVTAFAVSDTVDAADDTWLFTASAARPSVDALRWLSDSVCASRRSPCIALPTYAVVRFRHGPGWSRIANAPNLRPALGLPAQCATAEM